MLDLAILGLLKERAMHGYELKRQLGQRLGPAGVGIETVIRRGYRLTDR